MPAHAGTFDGMGSTNDELTAPAREADRRFFAALREADTGSLAELLTDDFVLVDVLMGSEVSRATLIDALAAGNLTFDSIDVVSSRVRRYGDAAIVVGRTEMRGRTGETDWSARSRYTHLFVAEGGRWRLASAQGTPIADEAARDR
jgi:ketosteroid isomerase-like protein